MVVVVMNKILYRYLIFPNKTFDCNATAILSVGLCSQMCHSDRTKVTYGRTCGLEKPRQYGIFHAYTAD